MRKRTKRRRRSAAHRRHRSAVQRWWWQLMHGAAGSTPWPGDTNTAGASSQRAASQPLRTVLETVDSRRFGWRIVDRRRQLDRVLDRVPVTLCRRLLIVDGHRRQSSTSGSRHVVWSKQKYGTATTRWRWRRRSSSTEQHSTADSSNSAKDDGHDDDNQEAAVTSDVAMAGGAGGGLAEVIGHYQRKIDRHQVGWKKLIKLWLGY